MNLEQLTDLQQGIRHMVTAISNASLYSPEHQQVSRLCSEVIGNLTQAMGNDSELTLLLIDDELIVDGTPLERSMYIDRFNRALKARGIGHIKFLQDITPAEIKSLVSALAKQSDTGAEFKSTDNLRFGTVGVNTSDDWDDTPRALTIAEIQEEEISRFMDIYESVKKHQKLSVVGINEIVSGFIDAFKQVADPLMALAPLRSMDEYTFTHSTNVCILNLAQAMSLGIDGPLLQDIGIAAMLHDIGKLFVPEEIINKPGKLDDREWEIMKQHPLKGAQTLLETSGVSRLAVVTAYEHHMKYDFTGYPAVGNGWQQNLCSQMTTLSDIFDAMRTKRSYKGAMELDKISGIMAEMAGKHLHPLLTRNFLKVLSKLSEQQTGQEGGADRVVSLVGADDPRQ